LLDSRQQGCLGYNSFYWRYFNCGRYPSFEEEISYYGCRKWALVKSGQPVTVTLAVNPPVSITR